MALYWSGSQNILEFNLTPTHPRLGWVMTNYVKQLPYLNCTTMCIFKTSGIFADEIGFKKEGCLLWFFSYFVGNNQYCVGDTLKLECDDNSVLNIFSAESVPSLAGSQVCRNQDTESGSRSENCETLSSLQVRILMNYIYYESKRYALWLLFAP